MTKEQIELERELASADRIELERLRAKDDAVRSSPWR